MAIAGAGIIGLSVALELAAAGRQVVVFERRKAMSESSWAAAGMLAAADPENSPALRPLAFASGLVKLLEPPEADRLATAVRMVAFSSSHKIFRVAGRPPPHYGGALRLNAPREPRTEVPQ